MKVGMIAKPNQKGQIVIPKEFRDVLGIDADVSLNLVLRGGGLYIYPVAEVITTIDSDDSYLKILEKTKGRWGGDTWNKARGKRRKIELSASKSRKQAW